MARARYRAELLDYQERLAEWHSLSSADKNRAHQEAEGRSLKMWSLGFAAFLSLLVYRYLLLHLRGDNFWIVWAGVSITVAAVLVSISGIVGRMIRGLFFGLVCGFVVHTALVSIHFKNPPSSRLVLAVAVLAGLLTLLYEFIGGFHSNGRPKPPSPPRLLNDR